MRHEFIIFLAFTIGLVAGPLPALADRLWCQDSGPVVRVDALDDILADTLVIDSLIVVGRDSYRVQAIRTPAESGSVQTVSVGVGGEEHVAYHRDNQLHVKVSLAGAVRWEHILTKQDFSGVIEPHFLAEWQLNGVFIEHFDSSREALELAVGVYRPDSGVGEYLRVTIDGSGLVDVGFLHPEE